MVNVIVLTAGKAVNVNWLRQSASIRAVMVTADVEKVFASALQDGQEKVVKQVSFLRYLMSFRMIHIHVLSSNSSDIVISSLNK